MRVFPLLVDGKTYGVLVEADGAGYHAHCPSLKGLHVGGDTVADALGNARDAILAYVESIERARAGRENGH